MLDPPTTGPSESLLLKSSNPAPIPPQVHTNDPAPLAKCYPMLLQSIMTDRSVIIVSWHTEGI